MFEYWEQMLKDDMPDQRSGCTGCGRCNAFTKKSAQPASAQELINLKTTIKADRLGDTIRRTMMTYIKQHNVF